MVPASLVILNPYTLKFKRSFCDFSKTVPTSELGFGSAPDPSLILMNWPHSFCHSKVGAHEHIRITVWMDPLRLCTQASLTKD